MNVYRSIRTRVVHRYSWSVTLSHPTMTAAHIIQRPLRGSRISTFYPIKSLPSLSSLDSAFQLQEYISLLIRLDVHDVHSIISLPGTSPKHAQQNDSKEPDNDSDKKNDVHVDQACWIYEQLRFGNPILRFSP